MKRFLINTGISVIIVICIAIFSTWHYGSFQPLIIDSEAAVLNTEGSVSINAVGDVMLGRKVDRMIKSNGLDYPVLEMKGILPIADITFCNLESSLSDMGTPLPGKGIWLRGAPENVQALKTAGFDIVTLANNHAMDYDEPALLQTVDVLDQAGIAHVGAGKDIEAARAPYIGEVNGVTIAWLGYSEMADLFFSLSYPRRMRAEDNAPGISSYNIENILADIEKVKDSADIIIVTLHWGIEYTDLPQEYQTRDAHRIIDAGADIIIGHHPHCIQGVEVYKNGLIAYSLGNFIFDQDWSEKTSQGLMLNISVNRLGWQSAEFLPIYIKDCQPYYAKGQEGEEILNKLSNISSSFGGITEINDDKLTVKSSDREDI